MGIAPIALFVYNRPDHLSSLLDSLKHNDLVSESELFVFSDGPRLEEDVSKVHQVREVVKSIDWCKKLYMVNRGKNMGLAASVIDGVTELVEKYGKVIVLEDDLVLSKGFLRFMNEALNLYDNEQKVMSVSGYIYPGITSLPDTFFIRGASCWGWATWKDAWSQFVTSAQKLMIRFRNSEEIRRFNFNNTYDYYSMLKSCAEGGIDSWAIRWYGTVFVNNGLCLYPQKSLVNNMGFDASGVHCEQNQHYSHNELTDNIVLKYQNPTPSAEGFKAISGFYKRLSPSITRRIALKVKTLFREQIK